MCGVVGIISSQSLCQQLHDALTIVQHRGQDAAGIVTYDQGCLKLRKDNGLVRDVIRQNHMEKLTGNMGLGHVRYPTAGSDSSSESQPFRVNSPYGLSIVHNGNLVNAFQLREDLEQGDLRHLNTISDSEVLLNVCAHELERNAVSPLREAALFSALSRVYDRVEGAFSALLMINGYGLVGFRDPHGIRPLVFGQRHTDDGIETLFASESIVLDALGYQMIDDVQPGEAVWAKPDGTIVRHQCHEKTSLSPCLFEFIYLSRPDSVIDGLSVYQARYAMGKSLAHLLKTIKPRNHYKKQSA